MKHVVTATFEVGPLPVLTVNILGPGTGKVTGAGAYAANKTNGSAPIIPTCLTYEFDRGDATSTAMVYVYLPPKDGKFAGHVKSIKLQWDKLRFTEVAP